MTHPTFEQLVDYADGRLAGNSAAQVEQHLAQCEACRADVAWLRQTVQLMAEDDWVLPPAAVRNQVKQTFREEQARRDDAGAHSPGAWLRNLLTPAWRPAVALAAVLAIVALGLLWWELPGNEVMETATATAATGAVSFRVDEGAAWEPLPVGTALEEGMQVRTADGASLQLVYGDGSSTTLGGNSVLAITELEATPRVVALEQVVGATTHDVVAATSPMARFEVETSAAVITAAGTAFAVTVDADGVTTVTVSEAFVRVSGGGEVLTVNAGETVVVRPGEAPVLRGTDPTATATRASATPAASETATASATPSATPSATATTRAPVPPTATSAPPPPAPTETIAPPQPTDPPPPAPTATPTDDDETETPEPTEEPDDDETRTPKPTEEPDDDETKTPEPTDEADEDRTAARPNSAVTAFTLTILLPGTALVAGGKHGQRRRP
jgi:hypothetical protein